MKKSCNGESLLEKGFPPILLNRIYFATRGDPHLLPDMWGDSDLPFYGDTHFVHLERKDVLLVIVLL